MNSFSICLLQSENCRKMASAVVIADRASRIIVIPSYLGNIAELPKEVAWRNMVDCFGSHRYETGEMKKVVKSSLLETYGKNQWFGE